MPRRPPLQCVPSVLARSGRRTRWRATQRLGRDPDPAHASVRRAWPAITPSAWPAARRGGIPPSARRLAPQQTRSPSGQNRRGITPKFTCGASGPWARRMCAPRPRLARRSTMMP